MYTDKSHNTIGRLIFWISLSLKSKTEIKRLKFSLSPELRLTNRCSANSQVTS